jgi:hypothetical protein
VLISRKDTQNILFSPKTALPAIDLRATALLATIGSGIPFYISFINL